MFVVVWPLFLLAKVVLFCVGLIAAPLRILTDWKILWLWGNDERGFRNEDFESLRALLWDRMIRNSSGNAKYALETVFGDSKEFHQRGNVPQTSLHEKDPMENPGFKWRYRRVGVLESFRVTWGKRRNKKGKKEIYGGFKIGSNVPGFGFTFQMRIF